MLFSAVCIISCLVDAALYEHFIYFTMLLLNIVKNFGRPRVRNFGKIAVNQRYQIGKNSNVCNIQEKKLFRSTEVKTNNDLKRLYSDGPDQSNHQADSSVLLPPLTNDEVFILPSLLKALPNIYHLHGVIKQRLDPDFNMMEFIEGTKQAVSVISAALAREDYDSLNGLIDNNVLNKLREKISTLTQEQRNLIAVRIGDIYGAYPYTIRVIDSDEGNKKTFVEIIMLFYSLRGLTEMQNENKMPPLQMGLMPEYRHLIFLCNYKFRRDYTKDNTEPWIVSMCNHMMMQYA